jgi:hypothetical protein
MQITFPFNHEKALEAIAYLLRKANGSMDKAKLMKLVYLADKKAFIDRGLPITGDRQVAMKLGPVPSDTLNMVDGDLSPLYGDVYQFIELKNRLVTLTKNPGDQLLSADERADLDAMWLEHGHKETIPFCYETHKLPEYKETYVAGTSTTIPYELIAKHSGNPARFRLGRPVISPEMAEHIAPPFPAETNLCRP